jgi:hypothetical protein
MPDDTANLFTIKHDPPGQISSGMSSVMLVTYLSPASQADADIDTNLLFLTSAGPMHVPVQCRRRFASLSVPESHIHLSSVMLGASKTKPLQITNTGALQVHEQSVSEAV